MCPAEARAITRANKPLIYMAFTCPLPLLMVMAYLPCPVVVEFGPSFGGEGHARFLRLPACLHRRRVQYVHVRLSHRPEMPLKVSSGRSGPERGAIQSRILDAPAPTNDSICSLI